LTQTFKFEDEIIWRLENSRAGLKGGLAFLMKQKTGTARREEPSFSNFDIFKFSN
jgi:hypothetical protein